MHRLIVASSFRRGLRTLAVTKILYRIVGLSRTHFKLNIEYIQLHMAVYVPEISVAYSKDTHVKAHISIERRIVGGCDRR